MKQAPYYNHYPEDFMRGCSRSCMTPEQVGMYIMLLDAQWIDQGPVEADYRRLAIMTGFDIRHVKRLVAEVVAKGKFTLDDNLLRNERMQAEIEKFKSRVKVEQVAKHGAVAAAAPTATEVATCAATGAARSVATETANEHLSEKSNNNKRPPPKPTRDTCASSESRTQNL